MSLGKVPANVAIVEGDAATVVHAKVFKGLRAFNREHAVPPDRAPLVMSATDAGGAMVGGLVAESAWKWLFVDLLWVEDGQRGRGIGRSLLCAAEAEARRRECIGVYLDTFDFQARPFYERLGYIVFGTLEDYPPGHSRFYLRKRLVDE